MTSLQYSVIFVLGICSIIEFLLHGDQEEDSSIHSN